MKTLIFGGNRFVGKKLATHLCDDGHSVTLLNRGNLDDGLASRVDRLRCDRNDRDALTHTLQQETWDIVYDFSCFDYRQAQTSCEVLKGRTSKYIFVSSQSVYDLGANLLEEDFDPSEHRITQLVSRRDDYAEAKRQAEVAFLKHATFDVVFARFPIIVGPDDYTNRCLFHVERIQRGQALHLPNLNAKLSLISSESAAEALFWLRNLEITGPLNTASFQPISLKEFISFIERSTQRKAILAETPNAENASPYGIENDWFMDCGQLKEAGFSLPEITQWLPSIVSMLLMPK